MCEFCVKHGEGKKWYLQARNYGLDLASDVRRQRFIADFFNNPQKLQQSVRDLDRLDRLPRLMQSAIRGWVTRSMKKWHFGQVVPLEDVREMLGIVNSVVRVPCICRAINRGDKQARYCFGVSVGQGAIAFAKVDPSYASGPDTTMTESVTTDQALDIMRDLEQEGLVHSVWSFVTPFIGGICNCDRSDCMAMIATVGHDTKVMFKAEWVAAVDWDSCRGCRSCMRQCQFGAIGYSASADKCVIDQHRCWGCGVCRAACRQDAISLGPRADAAALGW